MRKITPAPMSKTYQALRDLLARKALNMRHQVASEITFTTQDGFSFELLEVKVDHPCQMLYIRHKGRVNGWLPLCPLQHSDILREIFSDIYSQIYPEPKRQPEKSPYIYRKSQVNEKHIPTHGTAHHSALLSPGY
jgi:hypothetical protein